MMMDDIEQVIEPFVSNAANPFTDALAREGITRAARSLRNAVANGQEDVEAREDLAVASVMGGFCLANAKLGAVHGFAAVLGGMYEDAPHGAICACLLPYVFEKNVAALQQKVDHIVAASAGGAAAREDQEGVLLDAMVKLGRFEEVAKLITGNRDASITEGIAWLHALLRDINIPPLAQLCKGMTEADVDTIVTATMGSSSTKGNPIVLSHRELAQILKDAM